VGQQNIFEFNKINRMMPKKIGPKAGKKIKKAGSNALGAGVGACL
jgi:hypothetical protein